MPSTLARVETAIVPSQQAHWLHGTPILIHRVSTNTVEPATVVSGTVADDRCDIEFADRERQRVCLQNVSWRQLDAAVPLVCWGCTRPLPVSDLWTKRSGLSICCCCIQVAHSACESRGRIRPSSKDASDRRVRQAPPTSPYLCPCCSVHELPCCGPVLGTKPTYTWDLQRLVHRGGVAFQEVESSNSLFLEHVLDYVPGAEMNPSGSVVYPADSRPFMDKLTIRYELPVAYPKTPSLRHAPSSGASAADAARVAPPATADVCGRRKVPGQSAEAPQPRSQKELPHTKVAHFPMGEVLTALSDARRSEAVETQIRPTRSFSPSSPALLSPMAPSGDYEHNGGMDTTTSRRGTGKSLRSTTRSGRHGKASKSAADDFAANAGTFRDVMAMKCLDDAGPGEANAKSNTDAARKTAVARRRRTLTCPMKADNAPGCTTACIAAGSNDTLASLGSDSECGSGSSRSSALPCERTPRRSKRTRHSQRDTPQKRAKRPRLSPPTTSSVQAKRVDAGEEPRSRAAVLLRLRQSKISPPQSFAKDSEQGHACEFCGLVGSRRECEGELMGPFTARTKKETVSFYAHSNCLLWAPEVYADDNGEFKGVDQVYRRAYRAKCYLCNSTGGTLSCMFKGAKCCRPMHFRCALRTGAALYHVDGALYTLCPHHFGRDVRPEPSVCNVADIFVSTPVSEEALRLERTCNRCSEDNFRLESGVLLTCVRCGIVTHSRCLLPEDTAEDEFVTALHAGKYLCRQCSPCLDCGERLGDTDGGHGVIRCRTCNVAGMHTSCAAQSSWSKTRCCDTCRKCRQCDARKVSDWDETLDLCTPCAETYRSPDVTICPICDRYYKEGTDVNMIQCDDCETWVHTEECSGLSEKQLLRLSSTKHKYRCPLCKTKARPAKRKQRRKSELRSSAEDALDVATANSSSSELVNDPADADDSEAPESSSCEIANGSADTDVSDIPESECAPGESTAEPSADLWFTTRGNGVSGAYVGTEYTLGVALCSLCGSSGPKSMMRICAGCGEAFHGFCLALMLPERQGMPRSSYRLYGTYMRFEAGGEDVNSPKWFCRACARCGQCSKSGALFELSRSHGGEGARGLARLGWKYVPKEGTLTCDVCGNGAHRDCAKANEWVRGTTGKTICSDCSMCERCGCETTQITVVQSRRFCDACMDFIRSTRPCTICGIAYPAYPQVAPNFETECKLLSTLPKLDAVAWSWKCVACQSLVHTQCDSKIIEGVVHRSAFESTYKCPVCRGDMPAREISGSEHSGHRTLRSSRFSGSHGGTTSRRLRVRNTARLRVSDSSESASRPAECDWRRCELCRLGEIDGHPTGRLIPSVSDSDSVAHSNTVWIHLMCAIWSPACRRKVFPVYDGVSRICLLYATRKELAYFVRASKCDVCGLQGASIPCACEGCQKRFHFTCALESDCAMIVDYKPKNQSEPDGDQNPVGSHRSDVSVEDVINLQLFCRDHLPLSDFAEPVDRDSSTARLLLGQQSQIRANCAVCFASKTPVDMPRVAADRLRMRSGSLMLVNAGALVPESVLFLSESQHLIPTGYIALRRAWSAVHRGQLCIYQLEVNGTSETGPRFRVRCLDCPALDVCEASAEGAWRTVERRIADVQGLLSRRNDTTMLSGMLAFGLAHPAAIACIESLPLAYFFVGRYKFRFGTPAIPTDLRCNIPRLQYDTCANGGDGRLHGTTSETVSDGEPRTETNVVSCARIRGYLPSRLKKIVGIGNASIPCYRNLPSGELFQVRAMLERRTGVLATRPGCQDRSDCVPAGSRWARARCGGSGGSSGGGGGGDDGMRSQASRPTVSLPYAMQYRSMQATWRRRTVVLRSRIEGLGVFATEDIASMEMIIEYSGEIIRPVLSDLRELRYDSQHVGCYMFEVTPGTIVDATVVGNRARYINHSCDPNCFSKTVVVEHNRSVIVIFAKRHIRRGEELSYDYQFPLDDADRVPCNCGAVNCKRFMN